MLPLNISKLSFNMKKKALIFGGSGFLGSHLCEFLLKKNINVCVYDLKKRYFDKRVKFIKGNISNKYKIKKITKNFDYIFNFYYFFIFKDIFIFFMFF